MSIAMRGIQTFREFLHLESAGGIVMIASALLAMIAANSGLASHYDAFVHWPVWLGIGAFGATESLAHWINDILMVLFFFVIGMELKREMREGVLADRRQILLPLLGAVGGMVVPAALFLLVNRAHPDHWQGWAVPSATDIAFALAVLLLAAKRVPPALKIFLLAIAIFDDLGAIIVIALFYSKGLAALPLVLGLGLLGGLFLLNRRGVASVWPYLLVGVGLWFCLYHGGVHTTIGGVLVGMAIPLAGPKGSPLGRALHGLHPYVSFAILPLFAFANAGIDLRGIDAAALAQPLALGTALGLFVGKQLGIFGASWLTIRLGFAQLPAQTTWLQLYAVSLMAGIGFTMSLFIGNLAFTDAALLAQVKLGVIGGSLLSAAMGAWLLRRALKLG